jgi:hypothetical protein
VPEYLSTPIDTIGKLMAWKARSTARVFGCCIDCGRSGDIDLAALAEKVGPDWVFINRRWPVKCGRCGSRNVETRIAGK